MGISLTDRKTGTNAFSLFAKVKGAPVTPQDREALEHCAQAFGLPQTIAAIGAVWSQTRLEHGSLHGVTAEDIKAYLRRNKRTSVPLPTPAPVSPSPPTKPVARKGRLRRREPDVSRDEAAIGAHVEVEFVGESGASEYLEFDIVSDSEADLSSGFLGVGTPLAQAILGRRAGDMVPYRHEDILAVRILSVATSVRSPTDDVAAHRQAVIQEAINKAIFLDALRHALTVDVNWGDYDPEGMVSSWE